jgi:hypothetical protein
MTQLIVETHHDEKVVRYICCDFLSSLSRVLPPYPLSQTVIPGLTITRLAGHNQPYSISYHSRFTEIIEQSKQGNSKTASKLYCDLVGIKPTPRSRAGRTYNYWPGGHKEEIK